MVILRVMLVFVSRNSQGLKEVCAVLTICFSASGQEVNTPVAWPRRMAM